MCETRRVSRSWCSKLYTYVSILRLSTSHLYPHPDMWNLVYQWLESGTMSWDICDHLCPTTNLANYTQTSGSVLIVSASCNLASLSPIACRCLAQSFAVDLDFCCLEGRFGRHLASCIVNTFALQESILLSCMSTALEHFCKLRICSKLQHWEGSPAHLSTCVKCWRMFSSLDTCTVSFQPTLHAFDALTLSFRPCNVRRSQPRSNSAARISQTTGAPCLLP